MKLKSLLDYSGGEYVRSMTEKEVEFLFAAMMNGPEWPERAMHLKEDPIFLIMQGRLDWAGIEVTFPAMMVLGELSRGRPGTCVMLAYLACAICEKNNTKRLLIDQLVAEFGLVYPSEKAMQECWEGQKGRGERCGNKLDNPENWVL
jgi:hypothetical protein